MKRKWFRNPGKYGQWHEITDANLPERTNSPNKDLKPLDEIRKLLLTDQDISHAEIEAAGSSDNSSRKAEDTVTAQSETDRGSTLFKHDASLEGLDSLIKNIRNKSAQEREKSEPQGSGRHEELD